MTGQEYLSDALEFLEEELLEEADLVRREGQKKKRIRQRWLTAGAGLCAAGILVFALGGEPFRRLSGEGEKSHGLAERPETSWEADISRTPSVTEEPEIQVTPAATQAPGDYSNLPRIPGEVLQTEGMGEGEIMAYDISEIVSGNPWDPSLEISDLPVYRNLHPSYSWPPEITEEHLTEMKAFLTEIAGRLGIPEEELVITDDRPTAEMLEMGKEDVITLVQAEWQDLRIQVRYDMTAEIRFSSGRSLPPAYHFSYDASYEEMEAAASYLKEEYGEILAMEDPQISVEGGDFTYSGEPGSYSISFYEGAGDAEEQILQYNFRQAEFWCDDSGRLAGIRIYNSDLTEMLGEYPVITAGEAKELLLEELNTAAAPGEAPDPSGIQGGELVYRTAGSCGYFLPYYRFYVELSREQEEEGLNHYGIYYVPAVEQEFFAESTE